uniref:EF-hand domain-containing protein n=1 Tax=Latimeria chalumnae TaxID=7897 RepID=H3AGN2_LATCH
MLERAREMFQLCDKEEKGFITKRDMQRLQNELPLTPEQLEAVFDSLDQDNNGYLTPVEFSMGLEDFFFTHHTPVHDWSLPDVGLLQYNTVWASSWSGELDIGDDGEEKHFCLMMEQLGAAEIFEEYTPLNKPHGPLEVHEPHIQNHCSNFLVNLCCYIHSAHLEQITITLYLKNSCRRETDHDKEVRCLYEEMEHQIKTEKARLLCQDSLKQNDRNQQLQSELRNKEQELEAILSRQKWLESRLQGLNCEQAETRVQNEQLRHLNENLQQQLEQSRGELQRAQHHLQLLQEEAQWEQQKKSRDVVKVSRNMQREKESLLRQLELLRNREMNKKLRDERDAYEAWKLKTTVPSSPVWVFPSGSKLGEYFDLRGIENTEMEEKKDIVGLTDCKQLLWLQTCLFTVTTFRKGCPGLGGPLWFGTQSILTHSQNQCAVFWKSVIQYPAPHCGEFLMFTQKGLAQLISLVVPQRKVRLNPNARPVKEICFSFQDLKPIHSSVDRLFKVVFVGNSGVGKTSFIRRFCNDKFLKAVSTTVGMDYQVRNLQVDETRVALQLWDTAGQERFQSITKQYFRKADGVLVMYDVTVESSFTAVRNWMESIQSDVDKEAVIFLLGNKVDTMEMKTQVLKAEGEKLAQGYNAVFYECSALSDYNVTDSMIHLARLLTEQEDKRIQKAIKLGQDSKKKGCCN